MLKLKLLWTTQIYYSHSPNSQFNTRTAPIKNLNRLIPFMLLKCPQGVSKMKNRLQTPRQQSSQSRVAQERKWPLIEGNKKTLQLRKYFLLGKTGVR